MDITDYIPTGHRNAVTREELSIRTGICDRTVRDLISSARHHTAILNLQDGNGYYKPDMDDPVDVAELNRFVRQEMNRVRSINWALRGARKALKA